MPSRDHVQLHQFSNPFHRRLVLRHDHRLSRPFHQPLVLHHEPLHPLSNQLQLVLQHDLLHQYKASELQLKASELQSNRSLQAQAQDAVSPTAFQLTALQPLVHGVVAGGDDATVVDTKLN